MTDNVIQMPRGRSADLQAIRDLARGVIQYLEAGTNGNPSLALTALAFSTAAVFQTAGVSREGMLEQLGGLFDALPEQGPAND